MQNEKKKKKVENIEYEVNQGKKRREKKKKE